MCEGWCDFYVDLVRVSLVTSLLCLLCIVWSGGCEGTSCRHGDIGVGILGLGAGRFVHAILWFVHLEFSVHVPAKLLGRCLWIVELRLWLALE